MYFLLKIVIFHCYVSLPIPWDFMGLVFHYVRSTQDTKGHGSNHFFGGDGNSIIFRWEKSRGGVAIPQLFYSFLDLYISKRRSIYSLYFFSV